MGRLEEGDLPRREMASLAARPELAGCEFDVLLVADGSGTKALTPFGWACRSWDRTTDEIRTWWGCGSAGSNNHAELAGFVHVLGTLASLREEKGTRKGRRVPLRVLLASDSEVTVRCGAGVYEATANLHLWAAVEWLAENAGMRLEWRWVPRNVDPTHRRMDFLSRRFRTMMEEESLRIMTDSAPTDPRGDRDSPPAGPTTVKPRTLETTT